MSIDLCGEHGEFHTIVYDAPLFSKEIELTVKQTHRIHDIELCEFAAV